MKLIFLFAHRVCLQRQRTCAFFSFFLSCSTRHSDMVLNCVFDSKKQERVLMVVAGKKTQNRFVGKTHLITYQQWFFCFKKQHVERTSDNLNRQGKRKTKESTQIQVYRSQINVMINPMDYAHSFTQLEVELLQMIKILLDTEAPDFRQSHCYGYKFVAC